jgi:hypothetical protein
MLKRTLELPSMLERMVFEVENNAITIMTIPPAFPNLLFTISASGLLDLSSSCQGIALTANMAIAMYISITMPLAINKARGIFLCGSFVSSASFTISSNPT